MHDGISRSDRSNLLALGAVLSLLGCGDGSQAMLDGGPRDAQWMRQMRGGRSGVLGALATGSSVSTRMRAGDWITATDVSIIGVETAAWLQ